ncbi:MAG: HAD-IC family P-type ATPase, partial [bacterium]|nr:HAD-IC family P-type ATPase [bacterium]
QNSVFDNTLLAYAPKDMVTSLSKVARIDELPFDPMRKCESVLIEENGKRFLVIRGAPEVVFAASKTHRVSLPQSSPTGYSARGTGGVFLEEESAAADADFSASPLQSSGVLHTNKKRMPKEADEWAKEEGNKGCRVLAIGVKLMPKKGHECLCDEDEKGVRVLGMIAFADPLKSSSTQAIRDAERLGVRVKIITGDSKEVAGWVGYEAGVISSRDEVLTAVEFNLLSQDEKALAVEKYDVFARTTPLEKYAIIELLEKRHLVGFLGEGFNDAPALKMAHVGLAVSGASDIAQDASDIVLLNPSLEVIVDGIREGRKIFANSIKYIRATLASNFGNFYALAFASLFVPFLPMLPIQILLLNLLSDFPMISIAADAVDDSELKRPRGYQIGELTAIAIVLGIVSTLFDFAFFGYFMQYEKEVLQTMWFVGSVLTELILLFSIRTALPFWRAKKPSATVLYLSLSIATLTLLLPFIPLAQRVFGFVAPTPEHLIALFLLVLFYFISSETMKLLFYRFWAKTRPTKTA